MGLGFRLFFLFTEALGLGLLRFGVCVRHLRSGVQVLGA